LIRICNYCNFNKFIKPQSRNIDDVYEKALIKDITNTFEQIGSRNITSIYFGGGTPSLAPPKLIRNVIESISKYSVEFRPEITLEVNPGQQISSLSDFKAAGINRISMGIQSLDNKTLEFFGRDHRKLDAIKAVSTAKATFDNISLDFIWGRPFQSVKNWELELQEILELEANHLSLYQLTVEKGTDLHLKVQHRKVEMPNEDEMADLYEVTRQMAMQHGYHQYEISSFSTFPKFRGVHNLGYWRGLDYVGFGPGAHGRYHYNGTCYETVSIASSSRWTECILQGKSSHQRFNVLEPLDFFRQCIVFGLRMVNGVDFSAPWASDIGDIGNIINIDEVVRMEELGLLQVERDTNGVYTKICPTYQGLAVADQIILKILL
jgi:oxygen-independent coproporphyrinogen-3 oxidase